MGAESPTLDVPDWIIKAMIAEATRANPRECCGLLGGQENQVASIYPLENEAASPDQFLATAGLFEPMRTMRSRDEQLLAIYHSHPRSPATPSQRDLELNYYPDAVHFIVSLQNVPVVRAFRLCGSDFAEVRWTRSG
jgi:proteasome lid subunit RPN8/RPN11